MMVGPMVLPLAASHPPLSFGPLAPELTLVGTGLVLMVLGSLRPRVDQRAMVLLSLSGIVGATAAAVRLWFWSGPVEVLGGMVATDHYAVFFRIVILAVSGLAVLLSFHYLERTGEARIEYYPLLLFATAGMTLIGSATDLILVFLALEILSLALYLLTGFSFRRLASTEASIKYFLLGAFSSAFFLYGIAMAYGATGSTHLSTIAGKLSGRPGSDAIAMTAFALLIIGFGFKVAAVPFHMWTPDAYQGAPTCVTAFMSAGTKVAAFAAFIRVFSTAFQPLTLDWTPIVWILAAVTMVVGSVLAIAQTDVKRLLGYSSITQAGFVLVGMTAGPQGISGAMFYLAAYAAMILGAFGVVMLVSVRGEARTSMSSYAGLARRNPYAAAVLAILLLSLAGIPPMAGFIGKVSVFSAAIQAGHWPLALLGVLASVIAAFYYIRVIVVMYMQEYLPEPEEVPGFERAPVARLAVTIPTAAVVVFGIFPGIIFGFLRTASILHVR